VVRDRINERWMRKGVTMVSPESAYLDIAVTLSEDVVLYPGVILEGASSIGKGAILGPNCHLIDCVVGAGARVEQTVAQQAVIGENAVVGPFVALERGARVDAAARIGPSLPGASGGDARG
jgi:bifunctional UDP-N-acetylglucosamine pyrophosphorylase/glucosamine-1-phosphate N-acetyltransferase